MYEVEMKLGYDSIESPSKILTGEQNKRHKIMNYLA